ncbi:MAG: AMP-binding protein [Chlamydiia bacterium]|nr:AMP-binding protein [Chlamydiia bacterium]
MKKIIELFIIVFMRSVLWFRYRVKWVGLENLNNETLKKSGGVVFMPNHPTVFVDPVLVSMGVYRKYPIRPMIVEYFYYMPVIHQVMKLMNGLPVPHFANASNSLKRKRSEEVVDTVIKDLKNGDNFLIYPAGKVKHTGYESIGGASAVHHILQEVPEANVVLVRVKGLWGSSFSRALKGKTPGIVENILHHMKYIFMNLIFFTPRREVVIEYQVAPPDFPYKSTRIEMNQWLERWYNKPDGLMPQDGQYPGDSLCLVSYSMWKEDLPDIEAGEKSEDALIPVDDIDEEIRKKIITKLAEMTEMSPKDIHPDMTLDSDLGLDSLDIADLAAFLQDQFDIKSIYVSELTTVAKMMAIASGKITLEEMSEEEVKNQKNWFRTAPQGKKHLAPGNTMPEVFLNNCARMGGAAACADERAGVLTYKQLKMRVILLAEYIRTLPGEYIGIMLPSSVAAYATILATQLAGKVPMLINWTVGPRHLEAVVSISKVQAVLSSWTFIDRLENIELNGLEDKMIMLEDVRREFSLMDKLRAAALSLRSTQAIMKHFHIENLSKDSTAVLLFTSGTESLPKGVPLMHHNILSNQRQAFDSIDLYTNDVCFGILPPFHAFGFTISGFLGLLSGIKVVYAPDPTDGKMLARMAHKWGVTIMCGAPTFLKGMMKAGVPESFKCMRLCVTGAEKAPPELFKLGEKLGIAETLLEGYGVTECAPVLTINRPGKVPQGVGEPLEGIELLVVHPDTHEPLNIGERGLILARGDNIFHGYLNPDVKSPFISVNGKQWYNTGDLGYLDHEKRLTISGRQKRFIKVGAEMISLAAIEDALLKKAHELGWVIEEDLPNLAICAKEYPGKKPRIFLFVRIDTTLDEVNNALRESGFTNLVRVSDIVKVAEIPIMGTGKIHYRALENQYLRDLEE